ncbi:MAG: Aldose 1-epimerase, partial [Planctomycetota bacterium]
MAFQIQQVDQDSSKIFLLFDEVSGAMAKVAPSYGFNLFSLAFQVNQQPISIITEPERPSELAKFPSRFGHPILFPFPNRISGGKFHWEGQDYEIPVTNGGNAIHGFAHTAEWRVVETLTNDDSASITGEFRLSRDAPEHLRHWPADAQ